MKRQNGGWDETTERKRNKYEMNQKTWKDWMYNVYMYYIYIDMEKQREQIL